ncbi:MAG: formyltransferase family protein [Candidatus Omnitrophica bacterium]|nr:formyltransferase family protein [Candidatus Omnitrophota bacterium]
MKIVVLTPRSHFHGPVILREICLKRKNDKVVVVTTPKLSKNEGPLRQIRGIIKVSGFRYLWNMFLADIWFRANCFFERTTRMPLEERNFIDNNELIKLFRLEHYSVSDINSEESVGLLRKIGPEVIIADLFNQIISGAVRDTARVGCFNIHTSYLPRYRGIAPNFWALVNGEKRFGTSIHYVTDKIDSGPIVAEKEVPIYEKDTVFDLYRRCSKEAAGFIIGLLEQCEKGKPEGVEQDESQASYYSRITKDAVRRLFSNGRRFF